MDPLEVGHALLPLGRHQRVNQKAQNLGHVPRQGSILGVGVLGFWVWR